LKIFDKYDSLVAMEGKYPDPRVFPCLGPDSFPPSGEPPRRIGAPGRSPLGDDQEPGHESGTQTLVRPDSKTATPKFFKVVIHNDDFTPRDFVVHVLQRFFRKDETTAMQLMLQVHHRGLGVAGVFTHEIAETKAYQVNEYSKQNRYPLRTTVERDD